MTITNFYLNIYPFIIEFFLVLSICFLLLFGVTLNTSKKLAFPNINNSINCLSIQVILFTFILLINQSPIFLICWNNLFLFDSFSFYLKFLISFFILFWSFIFFNFYAKFKNFEFHILILFSLLAILLIVQVNDLLSLYVTIEFLSLNFYILASLNRNSEFSTEAGLKYFVLGALSSSILLFGITLLYSFTGLTNFQDFLLFFTGYYHLQNQFLTNGVLVSLSCIFISFLFKLGSAPFHYWLPDVYEGSPTLVASFFALVPKIAILALIIRFLFLTFLDFFSLKIYYILLICVFLSALVGTFSAFYQNKWKRFFAYSSIGHVSFFLISLCCLTLSSLKYLFIYLIIYLIMVLSFFSFFSYFNSIKYPNLINNRYFYSLKYLFLLNPILSISISIILLSIAGIPPLLGFFSKFFVLFTVTSNFFFTIIFFLLLINCVACFYYIRVIKIIYFNDFFYKLPLLMNFPVNNSLSLGFLIFIIISFFLHFDFIFLLVNLICVTL